MDNRTISVTPAQSLAELATRIPAASRVFREAGLDYCCGGKKSLGDACAAKGLDPQALITAIQSQGVPAEPTWDQRPLVALVSHIVERFHLPLRRELPELHAMATKVEQKHGEKASCPRGLAAHLAGIQEAVFSHLDKEEQILFPMIVAGRGAFATGPIQMMEMEHDEHGANLARTRAMTGDFTAPPEACPTWQALYLRLHELEGDLMDHIALENNILFPRALCE